MRITKQNAAPAMVTPVRAFVPLKPAVRTAYVSPLTGCDVLGDDIGHASVDAFNACAPGEVHVKVSYDHFVPGYTVALAPGYTDTQTPHSPYDFRRLSHTIRASSR